MYLIHLCMQFVLVVRICFVVYCFRIVRLDCCCIFCMRQLNFLMRFVPVCCRAIGRFRLGDLLLWLRVCRTNGMVGVRQVVPVCFVWTRLCCVLCCFLCSGLVVLCCVFVCVVACYLLARRKRLAFGLFVVMFVDMFKFVAVFDVTTLGRLWFDIVR